MIRPAALIIGSYLIGSIAFGLLIARLARGIDIREHGSHNPGATNVLRVVGPGWGILALLLDIAKGFVAVALLPRWLGLDPPSGASAWPLAAAIAAVGGHLYPLFAGFRGGKGVATAVGAFLALDPVATFIGIGVFALEIVTLRYVSLGSMAMMAAIPIAMLLRGSREPRGLAFAAGALIAVWVAWRHRANWRRLLRGEEPKLGRQR
jgi:glycerol-3-phosphate acyltransferase PlsY